MKFNKLIYIFLIIIFSIVIIFSLIKIYTYLNKVEINNEEFVDLKELVSDTVYSPPASVGLDENTEYNKNDELISNDNEEIQINEDGDYVVSPPESDIDSDVQDVVKEPVIEEPQEKENNKNEVLKDFSTLKALNNDFVGWLSIPNTKLDYPVMQTNNHPDYYLRKNFYKQYSDLGTPYAEEGCDIDLPSDNITIYGHHVKDGSIFGSLDEYVNKDYYENNKFIYFDTMNYFAKYEIIAVYKTVVYTGKLDEFKYWNFINAENEDEYNSFINKIKDLSLYNIENSAEFGDKLISLSTCEYSRKNGRLVIVAKMVEQTFKN